MILQEDVWDYVFHFCCAMYAPMCLLRLYDTKAANMDKLYFYTMQTEDIMPIYLKKAEDVPDLSPRVKAMMGKKFGRDYTSDPDSDEDDYFIEVESEEEEEDDDNSVSSVESEASNDNMEEVNE